MSGLISIAVTGIGAAQAGLLTTANNISNLNTEGYTRQRVIQASNPTVMTGAGGFGQGTHVVTVERTYSEAVTKQVLNAQARVSGLDTYYSQISQIDNLLADSTAGLSPAVQDFFNAMQAVATSPSSSSARQSMISSAQSMVDSFQSMYSRLDELESGVNSQISSTVKTINTYTTQIADLNQKIVSSASLNGQPVNDLLDKRDQLVADLNKLVKVDTQTNDDGSYNVFIGTGQQLVVGARATQMAAVGSSADPSRIVVGLVGASGKVQQLPENLINGGELGGLLSFRSDALDGAFNQLGLMAASIKQTFNAQNALGQDLLGQTALSAAPPSTFVSQFFTSTSPVVFGNANNVGNAVVSGTLNSATYNGTNFYTKLTGSDYRLSYAQDTSTIPATDQYTLVRLSDNTSWTAASLGALSTAADQGFTLADNGGTYSPGDSFLIQPTRDLARKFAVDTSVAADPRLVAAATPISVSARLANTGSASVSDISVGPGYSLAGLSGGLNLTYNAGNLSGFPVGSVTVTVGNVSTSYPIAAATDTVPYTSGATFTINASNTATGPAAISLALSGAPANGDVFTVKTNTSGVEDSGNIRRLGKLQTQNTTQGGTATYQDSYASFVNDIGNKASSAKTASEAQTTLLTQATAARESVSGVNKDEEAARLIQYQQAYQASAKVLEVANKLFDTLLSMGA